MIMAAQKAQEQKLTNFALIFTVGEETNFRGAKKLVEDYSQNLPFMVVGEPTNLELVNGHFGIGTITIKAKGKAAHTSIPRQGVNAIEKLLVGLRKITDFYLAKIPKGTGIETATVERTASFFREKDKFCFVIAPKKNLIGVELEISNTKTGEKVSLGKDIIFTAGSKPNINCLDFGSSQGMLNLDPGTYQYRFLMNHQALADIQFEVR
jgi:acetylornithine deacetylase/succinyl-diaminopimelate desuccinylase-like protein